MAASETPTPRSKLYGWEWQKARLIYLQDNPLCLMCLPRCVSATVVDHIIPHRGDLTLFWDQSNWQPLCKPHHDRDKQMLEKSGRMRRVAGADGWPR
jgi:5-methylcytosine-specific restriction enzyme A